MAGDRIYCPQESGRHVGGLEVTDFDVVGEMGRRQTPDIKWPADTSEAKKAELRPVLEAFDQAATEFENNHDVVFPSEAERLRLFHAAQKKWRKHRSRPGPCMYHGCTKTSVARSHTIPMSSSIKLIAEGGHVMTPRYGEKQLEVARVGIHEASTFPGFCAEHELLFAGFETKKEMSSKEHFQLQAFRTLCREVYTKRHQRRKLEATIEEYRQRRDAFIVSRTEAAAARPLGVNRLEFSDDALETQVVGHIDSLNEDLSALDGLYRGLVEDMRHGAQNTAMLIANFNLRVPVCLSGLGMLNYELHGVRKRALCFLAVIPEQAQTKIIIGAEKEHQNAIDLHFMDETSPALVARLESWMCHGSDHWFIAPSAWVAIPEQRRRAICDRILDVSHALADPVPFSVLDGTRSTIIRLVKEGLAARNFSSDEIACATQTLAEEQAKLDFVPIKSPAQDE